MKFFALLVFPLFCGTVLAEAGTQVYSCNAVKVGRVQKIRSSLVKADGSTPAGSRKFPNSAFELNCQEDWAVVVQAAQEVEKEFRVTEKSEGWEYQAYLFKKSLDLFQATFPKSKIEYDVFRRMARKSWLSRTPKDQEEAFIKNLSAEDLQFQRERTAFWNEEGIKRLKQRIRTLKFHQDRGFLNPTAGIFNFVLFAATLPVSAPAYLLIPADADLNVSESSERMTTGEAKVDLEVEFDYAGNYQGDYVDIDQLHQLKTKLANSEND